MRNPDDPGQVSLRHLLERCARIGVSCVLAAERGSRCYGTHAPGSDYDVVGLVACPPGAYAGIHPPPPTWGTEPDAVGANVLFNLNRGVLLVARGNVVWREVLHSACPMVDAGHLGALRTLADHAFDPRSAGHQYLMRYRTAAGAIGEEGELPRRWLQLVQPLASAVVTAATAAPPPVAFADLMAACPDPRLAEAGLAALDAKRAHGGAYTGYRSPLSLARAREIALAATPPSRPREGPRERVSHALREEADAIIRDVLGLPDASPAPMPPPAP